MFMIYISPICRTGCRECINVCPVDVYQLDEEGKTDPYQAGECVGCMSCVEVCPEKCIDIKEL